MSDDNRAIREATRRQHAAADPSVAAFVSAHAGSGKTHVLTGRVIRLLLEGVDPRRILCLTYTRAAAAEMKTRIFDRLGEWIDLDDEGLRRAIHDVTGGEVRFAEREDMTRPRRLFASALETPGGLKVQTIHAFCERLLKAFPVEAGLPPGFEVMDEQRARELVEEARRMVLAGAAPLPEEDLERARAAVATLAARLPENALDELLSDLLAQRHRLAPFLADTGLLENWRRVLAARLDVDPDGDPRAERRALLDGLDTDLLARLAEAFAERGTDAERRDRLPLLRRLLADDDAEARFAALREWLLKKDGGVRSAFMSTKVAAEVPRAQDMLTELAGKLAAIVERERGLAILEANMALLRLGLAVMHTYAALKGRLGLVDYDDLVTRTLSLLDATREYGAWVLYRLDGGIDHVLLDEAQDTSPQQWEIVHRLTGEFCAGAGAREDDPPGLPRTVFAVGDYKQSIYSFQGAEPEVFRGMCRLYATCFEAAGVEFREVDMNVSFRSAPLILRAVDAVLDAIVDDFPARGDEHRSAWGGAPGHIEMWLPERPPKRAAGDPWAPPETPFAGEHAKVRLARRMARKIAELLAAATPVRTGRGELRPMRPGDVLILLRSRGDFMDIIISALKQAGIPVAGADRLRLTDHLAVRDVLALLRFLANRDDDMSLACVLKSPLLARDDGRPFDDDDLLRLCPAPPAEVDESLWRRLRRAAAGGAPFTGAVARLDAWWREAGFSEPYAFLARVLGRDGGRRRFLARLGAEAAEPLDALLDMARAYEMEHGATPAGFADWLERAAPEIRREMDSGETRRDEVRVMTVHGAKGLEAPVVFLPDTCDDPLRARPRELIRLPLYEDRPDGPEIPFCVFASDSRNAAAEALYRTWRRRRLAEHYRLLYVAMTRARDRLYIAGVDSGGKGPPAKSWYATIRDALFPGGETDPNAIRDEAGDHLGWRLAEGGTATAGSVNATEENPPPLPAWVARPAPDAATAGAWLAPSRLTRELSRGDDGGRGGGREKTAAPTLPALSPLRGAREAERQRFRRGRLIHRLLELLPAIDPAARGRRALAWLQAPPRSIPPREAREMWEEVARLLDDPRIAPLFGPRSRAEVPFAARVTIAGVERLVAGQIDRLAITDDAVLIADYKTMRPAPRRLEEVPAEYLRQLALYTRAMAPLWPGKRMRALLVFTAAPAIVEIPPERLRRAFP